mgnify:CR=1 FL=1
MALKAIMLRHKIDAKKKELEALRAKDAEFAKREKELETSIGEANTDEEQQAVETEIEKYEKEKAAHDEAKTALENEISNMKTELAAEDAADPEPQDRGITPPINAKERMNRTMIGTNVRIRELPISVRAFDSLPMETREQIIQREDVKTFLTRLRELKGTKRAISGGDLEIPVTFLELIAENRYRYSKLLRRVRIVDLPGEGRQTIAGTVPEAIWTEMCGAINELNFTFNQITTDGYKVAGFVPVCNSLLEDTVSNLNLAAQVIELISQSIAYAEDKAILYGKGANSNMPTGIVTRLAETSVPAGYPANAPAWEDLHLTNIVKIDTSDMTPVQFFQAFALAAGNTINPYARGDRFWTMNSKTYARVQAMMIAMTAEGNVVSRLAGVMPVVMGDIDVLEFIPDGDIIGGYGQLYLWVDRGAMRVDVSEHVQFIQDNTVYRGKARADGKPVIPKAFVAMNINNTEVTTVVPFDGDKANDADLTALELSGNTLSPTFNSNVLSYTVATAAADTTKVEATTAQPGAQVAIEYNGNNVRNGGTVTLLKDSKPHPLTVTVKNGNAVKVYTVQITRAGA